MIQKRGKQPTKNMLHLSELIIYKKYAEKYFKTIENHSPSKKKKKKKYIYKCVSARNRNL